MRTCRDCIHNRVCPHLKDDDAIKCGAYSDKSRFIELPCAVGDYVEWDNGLIKTLYCVMGFMCDSAGFRFILNDFSPIVNHRNITRVLTKEEAEAELSKRSKENA